MCVCDCVCVILCVCVREIVCVCVCMCVWGGRVLWVWCNILGIYLFFYILYIYNVKINLGMDSCFKAPFFKTDSAEGNMPV